MFELWAVIIQKVKPITLYNRKLTYDQQRYTVTERELLSTAETLKEYKTILLGNKLRIYNNHNDLTCNSFNNDGVLIWRLILEQYAPNMEYIKGKKNIVAYELSRTPLNRNQ